MEALDHRLTASSFISSTKLSSPCPQLDLSSFTLVVDCTDNARTRYTLSDACVRANTTLVSGGAIGVEGWSGVWNLPDNLSYTSETNVARARGPCLRCIYPQSNYDNGGSCEQEGVLGTVTGVIGTLMASDAIRLIIGIHGRKI